MKRQKQDSLFGFWLIVSMLLHILLIVILWIGMPHFRRPLPEPIRLIPVEIAELAPITAAPRQKDEPPPLEPPKPEPPKPEPPKPEPKPPEPVKPPEPPKPEPTPEHKPEPKPEPKPKPPVPKKEPPKQQDALASVLKNVAKMKNEQKQEKKPEPDKNTPPAPTPPQAPAMSERLSMSEEDALRHQMAGCWNVPIGARDIETTSVEIYIEVGPDRVLKQAIVVDQARMRRDPFFRAVAESAMRALYNPHCSPLALPPEKYDQWKEMIMNFNPRDMF